MKKIYEKIVLLKHDSVNELIFRLYKFFKTQSTMHTRANARATFLAEEKKYAQRVIDKNIVNRAFMLHA